ncbi:MAG: hypothetical protein EB059_10985 [Alphaproteobacteria bacterium]|nr:hypothetical protein [Alphaproteobacteria bacterium]
MIKGVDEYIAVGNNIMFDASLVNETINISFNQLQEKKHGMILAHIENVSHSFSVSEDGARSYTTVIDFVRGLLVTDNGEDQSPTIIGPLDQYSDNIPASKYVNSVEVITSTSTDETSATDEVESE